MINFIFGLKKSNLDIRKSTIEINVFIFLKFENKMLIWLDIILNYHIVLTINFNYSILINFRYYS